jgi:pyridinium-3,5-biscarboxylic acid mononucleotide sulfurtransferase
MSAQELGADFTALDDVCGALPPVALALSGGIDSLTLAAYLRAREHNLVAFHAVSAAVPVESTARARALCEERGIVLEVIDAGEMADPRYLENPADRCFTCKSHLYDAIAGQTDRLVVSGTNADDLGDYRPGLQAAAARGVRHPFADAKLPKSAVRSLARALGLGALSELPAQPCLASRVETGIQIDPRVLMAVGDVERRARVLLGDTATVRCRVRRSGAVLELDERALSLMDERARARLAADTAPLLREAGLEDRLLFERYRMGSAFLRVL